MRQVALPTGALASVLWSSTRLGLTSFGGPVAHLGYFRDEFVVRRRWLDERGYADLVALCQLLPGPASSQVLMAIGMQRAGLAGGLAAWLGFTIPSAAALVLFGLGIEAFDVSDAGWLRGLKVVAVAVVANAVWGMARTLAADRRRATLAVLAAVIVVGARTPLVQFAIIAVAGLVGALFLTREEATPGPASQRRLPWGLSLAAASWLLFGLLLVGLPLAAHFSDSQSLGLVDSFYRVGSLVFGGGHVVLPLIEAEVVRPGWVTDEHFIAGYGAAQAVPGPLFSFAAYLGAVSTAGPGGIPGAALALVAIYVPSFLLLTGMLPLWEAVKQRSAVRAGLSGVNAAVVGLLGAALYDPVWTGAIIEAQDFALGVAAFGLLAVWRVPPWIVVVLTALGAQLLTIV